MSLASKRTEIWGSRQSFLFLTYPLGIIVTLFLSFDDLLPVPFLFELMPLLIELFSFNIELTRGVDCDLLIWLCPLLATVEVFVFISVDLVIGDSLVFFSSLFLDNLPALSSAAAM